MGGVDLLCRKTRVERMDTFKNAVIALLAGLLVLTLSTQNSYGAPAGGSTAKAIEYDNCIKVDITGIDPSRSGSSMMAYVMKDCAKYRP